MEVTGSGFNPVQFIKNNVKSGNLTQQEVTTLKDARKAIQDKAAEYRADGGLSVDERKELRQLREDFKQQATDLAGNDDYRVDILV